MKRFVHWILSKLYPYQTIDEYLRNNDFEIPSYNITLSMKWWYK